MIKAGTRVEQIRTHHEGVVLDEPSVLPDYPIMVRWFPIHPIMVRWFSKHDGYLCDEACRESELIVL